MITTEAKIPHVSIPSQSEGLSEDNAVKIWLELRVSEKTTLSESYLCDLLETRFINAEEKRANPLLEVNVPRRTMEANDYCTLKETNHVFRIVKIDADEVVIEPCGLDGISGNIVLKMNDFLKHAKPCDVPPRHTT